MPLLYGRTNYKLFLHRTFGSLDRRTAAILGATNVLPAFLKPVPIKAPFGRSMLVVAPHQDDEIIGCGGAMLLQVRAGRAVHVVFTQDGGDEHAEDGRTRGEQVGIREDEARAVANAMGIGEPTFLRKVHLSGEEEVSLAEELRQEIDRTEADVVCTPFILDYNLHHQRTNFALARALSGTKRHVRVMGYEVWGLTVPNVVVCIDAVADEKSRLLSMYPSQMSGKDYVHAVKGLNMYHSLHFGAGDCRYAERFFEIPSTDFVQVMAVLRQTASPGNSEAPSASF
jgi:LmbE family N-acetylglucosaminyl deacetylase